MPTQVNERVDVYTVFGRGRPMAPVKFRWRGRVHSIAETTYSWESGRGATRFIHFAVRTNADLFELVFDTSSLAWELAAVEPVDGTVTCEQHANRGSI